MQTSLTAYHESEAAIAAAKVAGRTCSRPCQSLSNNAKPSDLIWAVLNELDPRPLDDSMVQSANQLVMSVERIISDAVAAERAAILKIIADARADGHLYDSDYVLQNVTAAIRARREKP